MLSRLGRRGGGWGRFCFCVSGHQPRAPVLSEYGTYDTVKARFWPWLSGRSPEDVSSFSFFHAVLKRHLIADGRLKHIVEAGKARGWMEVVGVLEYQVLNIAGLAFKVQYWGSRVQLRDNASSFHSSLSVVHDLQGYLAHKKQPTPVGPPWDYRLVLL